jgi:hypothetical protein
MKNNWSRRGAVIAMLGIVTWSCGSESNQAGATREAIGRSSEAVTSTTTFTKDGNNGTVSCTTFCGGAQWGPTGSCVSASAGNFPCDQSPGLLSLGELTCQCVDPSGQPFQKDGNNGTVSCDTFCAGSQWGRTGSCSSASIPAAGCDLVPGFIDNGSELTCICQSSQASGCTKNTCASLPGACGLQSDGCGGTIDCSSNCKSGETCDGTVCVPTDPTCTGTQVMYNGSCCTPQVCQWNSCGDSDDGCGGTISCQCGCADPNNVCTSLCGSPINDGASCNYGPLNSDGNCSDGQCIGGT